VQAWRFHALCESGERDDRLAAGQGRTEAEMRAEAECQMPVLPGGVEAVGVGEDHWVAMRGGDQHDDDVAVVDAGAADIQIVGGDAGDQLDRWVVAQGLLDDAGRGSGIGAQRGEVPRVAQECQDRVGDEIDGGLVSGDRRPPRR
jgi:hypothetical protein